MFTLNGVSKYVWISHAGVWGGLARPSLLQPPAIAPSSHWAAPEPHTMLRGVREDPGLVVVFQPVFYQTKCLMTNTGRYMCYVAPWLIISRLCLISLCQVYDSQSHFKHVSFCEPIIGPTGHTDKDEMVEMFERFFFFLSDKELLKRAVRSLHGIKTSCPRGFLAQ